MSLPNNLTSLFNRIAFKKEQLQELIIDKFYNKISDTTFEAVILSEAGKQSQVNQTGDAEGNPIKDSKPKTHYTFLRVRPTQIQQYILPNPFELTDDLTRKKMINAHPLAAIDTVNATNPVPKWGQIWQCRFTAPGYSGIVLEKYLRVSTETVEITTSTGEKQSLTPDDVWAGSEVVDDYLPGASSGVTVPTPEGWTPRQRIYIGTNATYKNKPILNGQIPPALLGETTDNISPHRKGKAVIIREAMGDFKALAKAFHDHFGRKLIINSTYRPFEKQIETKKEWTAKGKPSYAATPGTSNHGWGFAFDYQNVSETGAWVPNSGNGALPAPYKTKGAGYRTPTYKWMLANAPRYNFENPRGMREGGSGPDEPWHFQWSNAKMKTVIRNSPKPNTGQE